MRPGATLPLIWNAARRLAARRDGNVALIVALVIGVLLFGMCMAIDYTMAASRRDQLQGYADAAALAATTPTAMATTAAAAQAAAQAAWDGQASAFSGITGESGTVKVHDSSPGNSGNVRTVTVDFTANSSTLFASVLGITSLPLKGSSSATAGSTPFINIYVLVDNSQSMGIADTQADMNTLYNLTQQKNADGCVFGCHVPLGGEPNSDEALAHQNNVTLRIDSAKSAITTMINLAQSKGMSAHVRFALYTMGGGDSGSGNLLKQVSGLSNNYGGLLNTVSNIDLEPGAQGVIGDTDVEDAVTKLKASLPPTNGNGANRAHAVNYVFVVTDGLDDSDQSNTSLPCTQNPAPGGYRCTQTPAEAACTALKTPADVGVIYTPYLPLYNNNNSADGYYSAYQILVQPYQASIQSNLQACASSPQLFFIASDGPSINAAMTTLFDRALAAARLTS